MKEHLSINNYKSIKELDLKLKRVNIFIGEPNSGKSNILEAANLLGQNSVSEREHIKDLFRFNTVGDLFFDLEVTQLIKVQLDDLVATLQLSKTDSGNYGNGFWLELKDGQETSTAKFDFSGRQTDWQNSIKTPVKFYQYRPFHKFDQHYFPHLNPPYGNNIPSLIINNKEYRELVQSIFRSKDYRLIVKPTENEINLAKDENDNLIAYPFQAVSETLRRLIFMKLAIVSNTNSVLLFDEPESHTFPFYTKDIAESIAVDQNNQYLITTHNPYLLRSLVEKTPTTDLNVFITYMSQYRTCAYQMTDENLGDILDTDMDFFLNLDKYYE